MSPVAARLQVLVAAVLFSTGGAGIKATELSGWQVASFRSGIAALVLVLVARGRRSRLRPGILLVGVFYAATLVLFVQANKLTTAASTTFLQSTAPLYLLVLGPLVLDEPVRRRDLAFLASLALGLALFFVDVGAGTATAPAPLAGNLLAALSGLTWAATVTGLRWMGRASGVAANDAALAAAVGNVIAFAGCLPLAFPLTGRPVDWLTVAYLGVVQVGLAYVFLTAGIRHVPALQASLLLLLEPVLNPLWAWWLHGERPGPWALAGGAVIVVATAARTLAGKGDG